MSLMPQLSSGAAITPRGELANLNWIRLGLGKIWNDPGNLIELQHAKSYGRQRIRVRSAGHLLESQPSMRVMRSDQ
jgi:hypothetical protein